MLEHLFEVGISKPSGMGDLLPIEQLDLAAWQYNMASRVSPWEAQLLVQLSREFCREFAAASDPNRPAPYIAAPTITPAKRKQVNDAFRALAARRNKRK